MKRILLAALLGGVTAYVWGAASWVILPWHAATLSSVPNDTAVVRVLRENITETGAYTFPSVPTDDEFANWDEERQQAWYTEYEKNPSGVLMYFERAGDPMSPQPFIGGLVIYLVAALIASWLLSLAANKLPRYMQRVAFVGSLGLFAALLSHIVQMNWGFEPAGYGLAGAADQLIGWLLAGCAIAWRVTPEGQR